jgi:hypothetical protein
VSHARIPPVVRTFVAGPRAPTLAATFALGIVAAMFGVGLVPAAQAQAATCQGQAATIEGPTDGQNTTGTEGVDVIVAPLSPNSIVSGLGGHDTICLVDGPGRTSRDPFVIAQAGAGNDSVVNETTIPRSIRVELGTGAGQVPRSRLLGDGRRCGAE